MSWNRKLQTQNQ